MESVLSDDEEAFLVFKGLIDLNDLGMVKRGKDGILVDDICW
jgi:hypothetical protein